MAAARPTEETPEQTGQTTSDSKTGKDRILLEKFLRMEDPNLNESYKKLSRSDILRTSPDYKCRFTEFSDKGFEVIHKTYAKFKVPGLVHDTTLDNFANILKECKIRPGKKTKLFHLGSFPLIFWGISLEPEKDASCKEYMEQVNKYVQERGFSPEYGKNLLESCPFAKFSRYGDYRLFMSVDSLIKYYEQSIEGQCQLRVLGTWIQGLEVMHTVLVHPEEMSRSFEILQTLEDYMVTKEYPVIEKSEEQWVWCPQSTSSRHPITGKKKCWDQLTFAFLIPKNCDGINVPFDDLIDEFTVHKLWKKNLTKGKGQPNWNAAVTRIQQKYEEKVNEDLKELNERIDQLKQRPNKLTERIAQLNSAGQDGIPSKRRRDEYPKIPPTINTIIKSQNTNL